VNEVNASTLYTTAYTYDPLKNLTRMVDALGNERSFSYDGLSRRVSAQDLHTTADTTFGSTTAAYDAAGNMVSEVTANGDTISYSYDALNRRLTEDSDSTGGVDVSFAYDTCTDGVGRLCIATSSGAVSSFTYSALGTTQSEARTIASTTYTTTYVHDRRGEVTSLTLPDLREVRFDHDSMGALSALSTKAQGGSFAAIVDSLAYNPMRQRTYTHVGNGLSTSHNYDSQSLYRLTSIVTATSTPTGTNTHSLDLERSSSQYASIPDASQTGLDITGINAFS
jgi:YD repeat-containing protein